MTQGGILTVFVHHDADINGGQVHLAGRWDEAPAEGGGITTFTGSGVFPKQATGWVRAANAPERRTASRGKQPNAAVPMFFPILGVSIDGYSLDVAGDLTGLDLGEGWYFILAPVGVDRETGATDTAPCAIPTRYLAFGYYYITPTAGVYIAEHETLATGIHGRQPGDNLAGEYYAWHRRYDPVQGRWTTPDPAMTPWWNLSSYTSNSMSVSDPNGLLPAGQQSDENWEKHTGVGAAISSGGLAKVEDVHNKEYVANGCGPGKCNVKFHFEKAYTGHASYMNNPEPNWRLPGVYVKISASIENCCCKVLKLIQVYRFVTKNNNGEFETASPDTELRRARAGWGDDKALSRGWQVDRNDKATTPFFTDGSWGTEGSCTTGKNGVATKMWDFAAAATGATNTGKEFQTLLVCDNKIVASVEWGFYIDNKGAISFRPKPSAACGYGAEARHAIGRWDKLGDGHVPSGLDIPDDSAPRVPTIPGTGLGGR